MSIKWRINLLLIILGITASLGIATFNYYQCKAQILNEAFKKAELISSFAIAARKYTVETARPIVMKISDPKTFHPELMGGFFVARAIGEIFSDSQPGYYFRQAALNPVNPINQATAQEAEMIKFFTDHPDQKLKKDIIKQSDGAYIFTAYPIIVEESCLKCHGSKETALPGRVFKYPGPGGYDYKLNSVIATFVTYIPIQKAMENQKASTFRYAFMGISSILLLVTVLGFFISGLVTRPVARLTRLANEISQGKEIHRTIASKRTDEIGDLYKSFERMRISVINLVKTIPKRKIAPENK
jgi:protein-histidine pros-kinase